MITLILAVAASTYLAYQLAKFAFSPLHDGSTIGIEIALKAMACIAIPGSLVLGVVVALAAPILGVVSMADQCLAAVADVALTLVSLVVRPIISLARAIIDGPIAKFSRWLSDRRQAKRNIQVNQEPGQKVKHNQGAQPAKKKADQPTASGPDAANDDKKGQPTRGPRFKPAPPAAGDDPEQPLLQEEATGGEPAQPVKVPQFN